MPSNGKEYQTDYMKKYVANAESTTCETCGGKYKTYSKYRHMKTKKHMNAQRDLVVVDACSGCIWDRLGKYMLP